MGNEYIDLKGMLALELPNLTRRLPTLRFMASRFLFYATLDDHYVID